MIVLDRNLVFFKYAVAYFPSAPELDSAISSMPLNSLLRVRQTSADIAEHDHLLRRSVFKTLYIDLTPDAAALRSAMDSTSRRWLNKAEKMRERVRIVVNDKSTFRDFLDLYNRFARLHAHSGPLSPRGLERFAAHSDVYVAYLDARAVCGHVWLRDEAARRVRLLFSASSRLEGKDDAAISGAINRLLHWHQILSYKERGVVTYDLGGFEHDEDLESSLTRFKMSMGARVQEENDYVFGRGIAKLFFGMYTATPQLSSMLRGRLPA
jgi:hypothetical protein